MGVYQIEADGLVVQEGCEGAGRARVCWREEEAAFGPVGGHKGRRRSGALRGHSGSG